MFDQSRGVDPTMRVLLNNLDQATAKLTEISENKMISPKEVKDLMKALDHVNSSLGTGGLKEKKVVPEEMNRSIEKALQAVALFHTAGTKNTQQAITSLFSSLTSSLKDFDKNLRNLKKHRIGRRVEKVTEGKKSTDKGDQ